MRRRTSPLVAGAVATALVLAGCGLFGGGSDTDRSPATTASTTTTTPEPELLDAGSAPRTALRLRFTEGESTTVALSFDLDVTQQSGGAEQVLDSPTVREEVRFTVDRVEGDEAVVSFRFTAAATDPEAAGLTPEERLALDADLQQLLGVGGLGRVDERGAFTSFAYDLPADLDPEVAASLDQFEGQLTDLALPVPAEPLGVGARWRTTSERTLAGTTVAQTTTYEITAIDGSVVRYTATTEQSATDQVIDPDTLPSGTTATLVSADLRGTVTGTMDLTSLVATSIATTTGEQIVDLTPAGGPVVRLTQQLDLAVSVTAVD